MGTKNETVEKIGKILIDQTRPLKERFRALFTLRNLKGVESVKCIGKALDVDPSALLKHECAYCLGQMQDISAVPILQAVLDDKAQDPIVRHEAAEALGAIAEPESIVQLQKYLKDPEDVVSETCQLALHRINCLTKEPNKVSNNPYYGVDPTPANESKDILMLESILINEGETLQNRYEAMFSLRNIGSDDAIKALCKGLQRGSSLYRHEIAFVLGQIQSEISVSSLIDTLKDMNEHEMVRHECAEALGSIATEECIKVLEEYRNDPSRVVKESCDIALDMCEYENNGEFQYADALIKTQK